jgi:hypothetical protein
VAAAAGLLLRESPSLVPGSPSALAVTWDAAWAVEGLQGYADGNALVVTSVSSAGVAVHHAGAAWDRGGFVADEAAWARYLQAASRRLRVPIQVSVTAAGGQAR